MDLEKAYNKIDNFCCSNHNTLQGNKVRYLNNREETIDMFRDYQETKDDDFCKDANEMVEALEIIKGLVDLQKEIGCPLDEAIDLLLKAFSKTDDYRCLTCINSMRGAFYGCDGNCQHKDSYTKKEIINLIRSKKREDKSE